MTNHADQKSKELVGIWKHVELGAERCIDAPKPCMTLPLIFSQRKVRSGDEFWVE